MSLLEYENPVRQQLRPGERLLWTGRPRSEVALCLRDLAPILRGFVGIVMSVAGYVVAFLDIGRRAVWPLVICSGFFALAGISILAGHLFLFPARRRRTVYAVTDQRVLVYVFPPSPVTLSFPVIAINKIKLTKFRGGTGDVRFAITFPRRWTERSANQHGAFHRLDNPAEARAALVAAVRDARAAAKLSTNV